MSYFVKRNIYFCIIAFWLYATDSSFSEFFMIYSLSFFIICNIHCFFIGIQILQKAFCCSKGKSALCRLFLRCCNRACCCLYSYCFIKFICFYFSCIIFSVRPSENYYLQTLLSPCFLAFAHSHLVILLVFLLQI